ncbi:MAG: hypothetical protein K2J18_06515 [Paramuribaculum sp.]|nr:hypothetical protein [Paramuribaculum sp.]
MKKYITRISALAACALAVASCSENSWNDHLEGFEVPDKDSQTLSVDFTMTPADYTYLTKLADVKTLAGANSSALSLVASQNCFNELVTPEKFLPLFMAQPSFPYFSAPDGSSVKMTYNLQQGLPDEVVQGDKSLSYAVTEEEYMEVWGSENDYVAAFAPSHPASRSVPSILAKAFPEAAAGQLVVATYQVASTDPVFTAPDEPVKPGFEMSDVLGSIAKGDQVSVNGYVTAVCGAGFILADQGGAVFVYMGSSFDSSTYKIGDQLTVSGEVSSYNRGLQITGSSAVIDVDGHGDYTYPAPVVYTGATLDAALDRAGDELAVYATLNGTVAVSGNNINIQVEGAETAQGSIYYATDAQKAQLVDGSQVSVTGYFIAIAGKRYCNFVALSVSPLSRAVVPASRSVEIASVQECTMYRYDGSKWAVADGFTVLSHEDYQAMGQRYDNLSTTPPASQVLPKYLDLKFPYAVEGDSKFVVYNYYASSTTTRVCANYIFNGAEWVANDGIETVTAQYVKNAGKWMYSPDVTITLPAGRGVEISTLYYQTCVDWIKNNVPDGAKYVTSYGNNEYYCGTSAYQGNVDMRPDKAREQYPAGYEGKTDDQIVELMKERFSKEVMPAALSILHPDADVIDGLDVIYTINFAVYTGTTAEYTIRFKVVGKAKFEFIDCDW